MKYLSNGNNGQTQMCCFNSEEEYKSFEIFMTAKYPKITLCKDEFVVNALFTYHEFVLKWSCGFT